MLSLETTKWKSSDDAPVSKGTEHKICYARG